VDKGEDKRQEAVPWQRAASVAAAADWQQSLVVELQDKDTTSTSHTITYCTRTDFHEMLYSTWLKLTFRRVYVIFCVLFLVAYVSCFVFCITVYLLLIQPVACLLLIQLQGCQNLINDLIWFDLIWNVVSEMSVTHPEQTCMTVHDFCYFRRVTCCI